MKVSGASEAVDVGVIEGFYGRPWSHSSRLRMASWLGALGVDAYLYAPKADTYLRRNWRARWPRASRRALRELADACTRSGIVLSAGLSPFAVYREYGASERAALQARIDAIIDCGAIPALLFDDMPGDCPDLAGRQAEVIADVAACCANAVLRVCPTYYSDDPVLDRVFGVRPHDYLSDLSRRLPPSVTLFWTGPQVCSDTLANASLPAAALLEERSLDIWDNYPVNDSRARSSHLFVQPFEAREPLDPARVGGHWSNAMNQAALSLPAIASLLTLYGRRSPREAEVFEDAGVTAALLAACAPLADRTPSALEGPQRRALEAVAAVDSPAAWELRQYLDGVYRFDPACLTD